jgi:hypothetical protein
MLARALKVHNYFRNEIIGTGIDTAALVSRAMKVALMAEDPGNGNDLGGKERRSARHLTDHILFHLARNET